jgi:hypothetical protein
MQVESLAWSRAEQWKRNSDVTRNAQLVLYFGSRTALAGTARFDELRSMFPQAHIAGCSAGGQIVASDVIDEGIAAVGLSFDDTQIRAYSVDASCSSASYACGEQIAAAMVGDDLSIILILSAGLHVNGTELIAGIAKVTGPSVKIVGGLAGDGMAFVDTIVGINDVPRSSRIGAIGFYGKAIRIGTGSAGGWDVFGPRRTITRAEGTTLFELDGKPALDLYERYLGDEAGDLPGSGLFFPLKIHDPSRPDTDIVRSLMSVDRSAKSVTFAGDVHEGWVAQLMRGNHDRLVAGAGDAGRQARAALGDAGAGSLALLVSCAGRRAVMSQRVADEVEAVTAALDPSTTTIGFYSYGEISPHAKSGTCEFQNQMMTVALLSEAL